MNIHDNKQKHSLQSIRASWLSLFSKNGYLAIEASSLVPKDDHSLLWINSGVAALKKYFNNPSLAPAENMVNCQRVIRTNDIDRIDASSYHQTLFEMLGCFSIGGNFKHETIPLIWDFFTNPLYLGINPKNLFITVLDSDHETYDIWREQKTVQSTNIIPAPRSTNFWDMGDGPCGPNTEIYYCFDLTLLDKKNLTIETLESKNFVEIINIVFSEFYHLKDEYLPLSKKCVDVGGGLERIALVLQKVSNTFQTDIWTKPLENLEQLSKKQGILDQQWRNYVIVDHLRTAIFAIADGALAGHKKHGYILKKLLKRSMLFGRILGFKVADLLITCDAIIEANTSFYPFLSVQEVNIKINIEAELTKFDRGFEISVNSIKRYLREVSQKEIPAQKIFFWYDTEGIPLELIEMILHQNDRSFNNSSFSEFLQQQKQRSFSSRTKKAVFEN